MTQQDNKTMPDEVWVSENMTIPPLPDGNPWPHTTRYIKASTQDGDVGEAIKYIDHLWNDIVRDIPKSEDDRLLIERWLNTIRQTITEQAGEIEKRDARIRELESLLDRVRYQYQTGGAYNPFHKTHLAQDIEQALSQGEDDKDE